MLTTNVDKILELLKQKKSASVSEIAQILKTNQDTVMKTGEYLEEDGVVKIEYRLMKPYLTLIDNSKKKDVKKSIEEGPLPLDKGILDTEFKVPEISKEEKGYKALLEQEISQAEFPKEIKPQMQPSEEQPESRPRYDAPAPKEAVQVPPLPPAETPPTEPAYQYPPIEEPSSEDLSPAKVFNKGITEQEPVPNLPQTEPQQKELPRQEVPKTEQLPQEQHNEQIAAPEEPHKEELHEEEAVQPQETPVEIEPAASAEVPEDLTESENLVVLDTDNSKVIGENIDDLIEKANEMLDSGEVDGINSIYEKVFTRMENSSEITGMERKILKHKVALLFNRIKQIYEA